MYEIDIAKTFIFYIFAVLLLLFALISIFSVKIAHSVLFAVFVFWMTAGVFFLLGADYNAVVQIAVYGVTVPVLFLFSIITVSKKQDKSIYLSISPKLYFSFLSLGVLLITLTSLISVSLTLNSNSEWIFQKQTLVINKFQMFKALASGIFSDYAIPFEAFSFLLLIVVVGLSSFNFSGDKSDE